MATKKPKEPRIVELNARHMALIAPLVQETMQVERELNIVRNKLSRALMALAPDGAPDVRLNTEADPWRLIEVLPMEEPDDA